MENKDTIKDKKLKEILSDLMSKDEGLQKKAVKSLKIHGDESMLEPLLIVFQSKPVKEIQMEIIDLFNTIKSSHAPKKVAELLMNPAYKESRQILLSSIWNSGLDYRPYLREIAITTVEGDMLLALDMITIIENIEGTLSEDEIFEPLLIFKEYLAEAQTDSDPKNEMIREIVTVLESMNDLL